MLFLEHGPYPEFTILDNGLNDGLECLSGKAFASKNLPNLLCFAGGNQIDMVMLDLLEMVAVVDVCFNGLIIADCHAKAIGDEVRDTQYECD